MSGRRGGLHGAPIREAKDNEWCPVLKFEQMRGSIEVAVNYV